VSTPSAGPAASSPRTLGAAPVLPVRIAAQVAWNSLRVRLARSLVTVSSVVLAVAFLFSVVGEHLVNRAVHDDARAQGRSAEWAQALRDALARPRETLALLALLAHQPDEAAAWQLRLTGRPLPPVNPALALLSEELAIWLQGLKPTQTYLVTRNQPVAAWLLDYDDPEETAALLAVTRDFKGVRLPFSREELAAIALHMPTVRAAIALLREAEQQRLALVAAAGGVDAVLRQVYGSDDASAAGLPLSQVMPGAGRDGRALLRAQLRLDQARTQAVQALAELNRDAPAVEPPGAATSAPHERAAAEAFDLQVITDPARLAAPANASTRQQLVARLGEDMLGRLGDELRRRARLAALNRTFAGMAYDPEAGGTRTFWLVALSLLVCVVGIVNAMMMAVSERFREIATMKCLGATDDFILKAFLIEAGTMGVAGSLLGLALGLALVAGQGGWRFGDAFWSALPTGELLLAGAISLICGLALALFGALLPALRAARMPPVEAMRVET
jgi:hypothetical protein